MSLTTMTSLRSCRAAMESRASPARRGADGARAHPAHAPGPGPVPEPGDDGAVLPAQPDPLRDPLGPRQGGGGGGVLHPVVRGLRARRVARQAALPAQCVEIAGPAGEDLVDVALVPGVEDDRIIRGVEDPVDGEGELHHAEVRAEMAPGAGDVLDEEPPDLGGQFLGLSVRQFTQIIGTGDVVEQCHGPDPIARVGTARTHHGPGRRAGAVMLSADQADAAVLIRRTPPWTAGRTAGSRR